MTVSYNSDVATSSFACFWRLLFRWRGSVFKLLWKDLLIFSACYAAVCLTYNFALDCEQRRHFYHIAGYCKQWVFQIPLTFLLAFFVSLVLQRWWAQVELLPFPDSFAFQITANLAGHDKRGRMLRRTLVRYVNLSYVLKLASISPQAKKRFPSMQHLIEAGLLTDGESNILQGSLVDKPPYVVPIIWAAAICQRAFQENRIENIYALHAILEVLFAFRGKLGFVGYFDWINIPMVYLQVVSVAIHSFFLAHLFGHVEFPAESHGCALESGVDNSTPLLYHAHITSGNESVIYLTNSTLIDRRLQASVEMFVQPVFVVFQFIFYMGWLKVAESLVNPFGEDDDNIEINWIIDRNRNISYRIVDDLHAEHPDVFGGGEGDDAWFDPLESRSLPLTLAVADEDLRPFEGSAAGVAVPPEQTAWICQLETIMEEAAACDDSSRKPSIGKAKGEETEKRKVEEANVEDQDVNGGDSNSRGESSVRTHSLPNQIPAVLVTKKEMEKGKLSRTKGAPDRATRLVEPKRLPRHLALRPKADVCDSDSLASLAARIHRKDLETQVKRSATRDAHSFDDRLSQSSAPSGKAFLIGRLHESLQTRTADPPSPELNRSDNASISSKMRNLNSARDAKRVGVARGMDARFSASRRNQTRKSSGAGVGQWTPSSSRSSLFHMSDLTSLTSAASASVHHLDSKFLELNFLKAYGGGGCRSSQRPSSQESRLPKGDRFPLARSASVSDDATDAADTAAFALRFPAQVMAVSAGKEDSTPLGSAFGLDKDIAFAEDWPDGEKTITDRKRDRHPGIADIEFSK